MTASFDDQKQRDRGMGKEIFWILVGVLGVVILVGADRGLGRDHGADRLGRERHEQFSVEKLHQHLDEGSRWLEGYGVTPAQQDRLSAIVAAVVPEAASLRARGQELTEELARALENEVLAPHEIERLRSASLRLAQNAVDVGFDVLLQAAQVLTPEQRADLVQHWRSRR